MEIQPQTDREILLQLNSDVKALKGTFKEVVDRLSETIERFGQNLKVMEDEKISVLTKEVEELKAWRSEIRGGYKLAMLFWAVLTAGMIAAAKYFLK
jgi:hypothetical protein